MKRLLPVHFSGSSAHLRPQVLTNCGDVKKKQRKDDLLLENCHLSGYQKHRQQQQQRPLCMTIQTHTVLQKLCLGIKITTQDNYVTLIIICHEHQRHQNKLEYIL